MSQHTDTSPYTFSYAKEKQPCNMGFTHAYTLKAIQPHLFIQSMNCINPNTMYTNHPLPHNAHALANINFR